MKILAITQARYGSSRLPAKILKEVNGITLLEYHLRRILQSKMISSLKVATTVEESAEKIVNISNHLGINTYKGSINDVLDRFYQTAKPENPDYVVRLTSDCPLIDPEIIDSVIQLCINSDADYASNTLELTFPDGMDCEVFKFQALEKAWKEATLKSDREHVTPYIWRNSTLKGGHLFKSVNYTNDKNWGDYRITVDTIEDFEVVKNIIEQQGIDGRCADYVKYLDNHKEVQHLNQMYERNEGFIKSLKND